MDPRTNGWKPHYPPAGPLLHRQERDIARPHDGQLQLAWLARQQALEVVDAADLDLVDRDDQVARLEAVLRRAAVARNAHDADAVESFAARAFAGVGQFRTAQAHVDLAAVAAGELLGGQARVQRQGLAVAQHLQVERRADLRDALDVVQVVVAVYRLAIDRRDHVAGLDARLLGRRLRRNFRHHRALLQVGLQQARDLGCQRLRLHAERAVLHMAAGDQLAHRIAGAVDRNRKADADIAAGRRVDRRIDADQLAAQVDQRAAGVARVDRRIGLDVVLETDAA